MQHVMDHPRAIGAGNDDPVNRVGTNDLFHGDRIRDMPRQNEPEELRGGSGSESVFWGTDTTLSAGIKFITGLSTGYSRTTPSTVAGLRDHAATIVSRVASQYRRYCIAHRKRWHTDPEIPKMIWRGNTLTRL